MPKLRQIDLAWPICRCPFGSGGNRVTTRPPFLPACRSAATISRIKSDAGGASVVVRRTALSSCLSGVAFFTMSTPYYRENTPRYGVRVSHSLRQRLNDPIIPAIAKFLQKRHDVFLARLVVAINSGS